MREFLKYCFVQVALLAALIATTGTAGAEDDRFRPPFDETATVAAGDSLSLAAVLTLVAEANPTLKALDHQVEAARRLGRQAGRWPNPELETEFEEVGWDAPGLRDAEMSVVLSQEFEFFGQRDARRELARAGIKATRLSTKFSAFDLFLEVKGRFYALAFAQKRSVLADSSVSLAESIVSNITQRIEKGAALQAELLLARLELQRFKLAREKSAQDLVAARIRLTTLFNGDQPQATVKLAAEMDLRSIIDRLPALVGQIDSSRQVIELQQQTAILHAEQQLAAAEAKPNITLSGGYKRLAADGSNTLLFGLSLPLPIFNRNQGVVAGLDAQLSSLEYERQRARLEATAGILTGTARLTQLINSHAALDTLLLPTAEAAYRTLRQAYHAGRVPYASLLEAERALIELRFERNDILPTIHEELIALERITGVILYPVAE